MNIINPALKLEYNRAVTVVNRITVSALVAVGLTFTVGIFIHVQEVLRVGLLDTPPTAVLVTVGVEVLITGAAWLIARKAGRITEDRAVVAPSSTLDGWDVAPGLSDAQLWDAAVAIRALNADKRYLREMTSLLANDRLTPAREAEYKVRQERYEAETARIAALLRGEAAQV